MRLALIIQGSSLILSLGVFCLKIIHGRFQSLIARFYKSEIVKDDLIAERISTIDIHLYILTIVFAFVAVILSWYCVKNIARNRLIGGALLMISFFVFLFSFFPL
jgi:hypothetical protein